MYLPPTSRASAVNAAMSRPQSVFDAGVHECVGRVTGQARLMRGRCFKCGDDQGKCVSIRQDVCEGVELLLIFQHRDRTENTFADRRATHRPGHR